MATAATAAIDPTQQKQYPTRPSFPPQARGIVVRAPGDYADSVVVQLSGYSADTALTIPATNWMPSPVALPEANAQCLVLFDNEGDAWLLAWQIPRRRLYPSETLYPSEEVYP